MIFSSSQSLQGSVGSVPSMTLHVRLSVGVFVGMSANFIEKIPMFIQPYCMLKPLLYLCDVEGKDEDRVRTSLHAARLGYTQSNRVFHFHCLISKI